MGYKKICKLCGKEFIARNSKVEVCPDRHTSICIVCGNEFELKWPYTAKTCSRDCRSVWIKQSGIGKARSAKAKETLKAKYGVSNPSELQHFKRICAYCGKEFETTNSNQKYCFDDHYGPCPVCGKLVKILDMSVGPTTCSDECENIKRRKTNLEKYGAETVFQSDAIKEKIQKTNLEKYGVPYYSQTEEYRIKFENTSLERYGTKHPVSSEVIKNKIKATNIERYGGISPSSDDKVKSKQYQTFVERYGGYPFSSPILRSKIDETLIDRYGTTNILSVDKIRNKSKETSLQRYGVENPIQSKEVRDKGKNTSRERYGVDFPSQADEIKSKVKDTVKSRFGVDNVFQSEDVKRKIKSSMIEKYGVDNPMKCDTFKDKARETSQAKYGSEYYNQSIQSLSERLTDPKKICSFLEFKTNPQAFLEANYSQKVSLNRLADDIGVNVATVSKYVLESNCQSYIAYHYSSLEESVVEFLRSINPGIEIVLHNRSIISPYEIDVYLPEYKLGIECNPTITHNSSIPDPWGVGRKPYNYHKIKSDMCAKEGIFLFHIFGYEWSNRKNIILSMIAHLLNHDENVIYARNTYVCDVPNSECSKFLDNNHLQGSMNPKIRLGLRLKSTDELVSVMTFNRTRSTIGNYQEGVWELSRFCSKLNTSVVGGASKLFKSFLNVSDCKQVVSYSNVSHTKGTLYEKLGFQRSTVSPPGYVWVDLSTDNYLNRLSTQKQRISSLFPHDNIDLSMTESQIMESHGYVRVYDSGTIKWVYIRTQ